MPRLIPLALALCAALAIAGCGTAGTTVSTSGLHGDAKAVADTVSSLQSDAQAGDAAKVCGDLAPSLVKQLSRGSRSCANALPDQLKVISDFSLSISSVKVSGNTATARVKDVSAGKTHYDTLRLVKVGNAWKVSGLQ